MNNSLSNTFFIADTHFGHDKIIRFENRPFKDAAEMNSVIIENWNKTVKQNDTVFVLGDFAVADENMIKEWVSGLNGYKILVLGNHDRNYSYSWWRESGFDEVSAYPIIYNEWYILSHEPLYINSNMPYANIFGHVHSNPSYLKFSSQSFCVSAERINYTPLGFHEMLGEMKR